MFFRQRIQGCSCAMKEIVDVDFLITSKNGDKKSCNLLKKIQQIQMNTPYLPSS